jgi:hypothetical protein
LNYFIERIATPMTINYYYFFEGEKAHHYSIIEFTRSCLASSSIEAGTGAVQRLQTPEALPIWASLCASILSFLLAKEKQQEGNKHLAASMSL